MVMFKFENEVSKPIKERSYVYDLHYHVVWVTKYRVHAFNTDKVVNALKNKLLEIAKDNGYTIEAMEIMPNHVHLLLEVDSYDTSKTCNKCGKINEKLKVGEKEWTCPNCGQALDRDYNASLNIRDWAQDITKHPKHGKTINGRKVKDSDLLLVF